MNNQILKINLFILTLFCLPTLSNAQQVISENLLVQGSLGVGTGIGNSESFADATIKLKENNLRILFEDNSDNTGNFASNDWQITINDPQNGGANYYAIEDVTGASTPFRIMAGAENNALYVSDTGGRIGMGTNNPLMKLHVQDGDSPTLRLEQDGSSGWDTYRWDIVGNEANFFVRDANTNQLPVRIKPGAPTNTLFLHASGAVSIGTETENSKLYVDGAMTVNGDINTLSDRRIKTDIKKLKYGLADVLKLSPKSYRFDGKGKYDLTIEEGTQLGLIAQEVQSLIPEIVEENINIKTIDGQQSTLKAVNYTALVPVLINAIQEQQQIIETKEKEIEMIQRQMEELTAKVEVLTNRFGQNNKQPITTNRMDQDDNYIPNNASTAPQKIKTNTTEKLNDGRN